MVEESFKRCVVCREKQWCLWERAKCNPVSGKYYHETFINENTGNVNHPWPEGGSWVWICERCKGKSYRERIVINREGLRLSKLGWLKY